MRPKTRDLPAVTDQEILACDNVPVELAARYLGSSTATLYEALQDERVPFGWAVQRNSNWAYNISPGGAAHVPAEGRFRDHLRGRQPADRPTDGPGGTAHQRPAGAVRRPRYVGPVQKGPPTAVRGGGVGCAGPGGGGVPAGGGNVFGEVVLTC